MAQQAAAVSGDLKRVLHSSPHAKATGTMLAGARKGNEMKEREVSRGWELRQAWI